MAFFLATVLAAAALEFTPLLVVFLAAGLLAFLAADLVLDLEAALVDDLAAFFLTLPAAAFLVTFLLVFPKAVSHPLAYLLVDPTRVIVIFECILSHAIELLETVSRKDLTQWRTSEASRAFFCSERGTTFFQTVCRLCWSHTRLANLYKKLFDIAGSANGQDNLRPSLPNARMFEASLAVHAGLQTAVAYLGFEDCRRTDGFQLFHGIDDLLAVDHHADRAPIRIFQCADGR